ncbi:MAG: cell division control protein Cdc6 [Candidatus Diapherotrites archaeon CG08_land_8_20_14_0_20_34_12]|nr:MAG: cell division control protein Cdc6 [Candidatus Diapherotrites archaeon CG08_land_8_20_14_0_20_34_12]
MSENLFKGIENKSKIFKNRDVIGPHYIPEKILFRKKQIDELVDSLGVTIKGKKADNVFIYGKTGTGKTSTAKYVLNQLLEYKNEAKAPVRDVYLNCRNYNSKYKVIGHIVKKFYTEQDYLGYSSTFIYEKMTEFLENNSTQLIVVLDEVDKIKDLDELIYSLVRTNDELKKSGISIIGISNKLTFKERLDPRSKSSLCEKELLFPPYNANELKAILEQRVKEAFYENTVDESAINLAAAIAAQESGDARTAVMLLLRAGELAEKEKSNKVTDVEVKKAKSKVEEEIMYDMISTLPEQQQLVLYSIAKLTSEKKGVRRIGSNSEENILLSGEVYDCYSEIAKIFKEEAVSSRWYREYINELEMYGLITTTASGKGIRGNTQVIKLGFEAEKIKNLIEKNLLKK